MSRSAIAWVLSLRIFRKSPANGFLRFNRWIWKYLRPSAASFRPIHAYGVLVNSVARLSSRRNQNVSTFFLRNRPQLELIRRLSDQKDKGSTLNIAVLACSKGAEVYSILWTIRSARPDLNVVMHASDISEEVLKYAQKGIFSLTTPELIDVPVFERVSQEEIAGMFDREGDKVRIKSWIAEGIIWNVGNACDPSLLRVIGAQEIVIANNFLCHMGPAAAENCLREIAGLVKPGGYLFISGIDLSVRARVAMDLGWKPVIDLIEEIHDGDPSLRDSWPWGYWGLEPFNKKRTDWEIRYASCFQLS